MDANKLYNELSNKPDVATFHVAVKWLLANPKYLTKDDIENLEGHLEDLEEGGIYEEGDNLLKYAIDEVLRIISLYIAKSNAAAAAAGGKRRKTRRGGKRRKTRTRKA